MFRIAVCEDEPHQRDALLSLLDSYKTEQSGAEIAVTAFDTGERLLDVLDVYNSTARFDLYLLDILMPGINGIELARKLRERDTQTPLIFLTASSDYALEAFDVSAAQYLLKPVSGKALFAALDKSLSVPEDRFIMIPAKESTVRVPISRILYVELAGRVLRVALDEDGGVLYSKTVRVPFAEAVAPLLSDARFLHAHKSYVLNMSRVRELTSGAFVMEDGTAIPIPRSKYTEAKNRYFDFLSVSGVGTLGGVSHAR